MSVLTYAYFRKLINEYTHACIYKMEALKRLKVLESVSLAFCCTLLYTDYEEKSICKKIQIKKRKRKQKAIKISLCDYFHLVFQSFHNMYKIVCVWKIRKQLHFSLTQFQMFTHVICYLIARMRRTHLTPHTTVLNGFARFTKLTCPCGATAAGSER